jgi:hypothetical protein
MQIAVKAAQLNLQIIRVIYSEAGGASRAGLAIPKTSMIYVMHHEY